MEAYKNCPSCGRLFTSYGNEVCQTCFAEEEKDFKLVKEYIYDHGDVNVMEVSEGTGVSPEKILRFLKNERLYLASSEGCMLLVCESCGIPIQSGRYCLNCIREFELSFKKEFSAAAKNAKGKENANGRKDRMYTAIRRK
ncbi:MAG TPA: MerR family transcriptional regulator [Clostridia bacterium]|nr:MerR family transcriptional regulator [Clostridia bacterium]